MKKIVSVFIALIMMFSTMCVCAIPAFASEQWEPRPYVQDTLGCVNGEPADIGTDYDASLNEIIYSYNGAGTVTDWELPLLEEGKDFEIVSKEENKFVIKTLSDETVIPYINAVVDFEQNENISEDVSNFSQNRKTDDKAISNNTESSNTVNNDNNLTGQTQNTNKLDVKGIALICAAVIVVAGVSLIIFKKR